MTTKKAKATETVEETVVVEKNKFGFFHALKKNAAKAATTTAHAVTKTAKSVGTTLANVAGYAGTALTRLGLFVTNVAKTTVAMAVLGADVILNLVGVAAVHTLHAAYKVVYGVGLLIALPSIAVNGGSNNAKAAVQAYGKMWTPTYWKATNASQVWGTTKVPANAFVGTNLYDFAAYKAAKTA
jgi:hypothetical protein